MRSVRFREVVSTRYYNTRALNDVSSHYYWENTNKLIGDHWIGCKTGVTEAAGPCFSGWYEDNETGEQYCVVVLSSKSMDQRWVEVPKMVEWAIKSKQLRQ